MKELCIRKSKARRQAYHGWRGPIWIALILAGAMAIYLSLASRIPEVAAGSSAASASPSSCWDPVKGHCYPRTRYTQWGGAPVEWYAKFDMLISASVDIHFIQEIYDRNPNVYYFPTRDWNCGIGADLSSNQIVHNSAGEYIGNWPEGYCDPGAANLSTAAPSPRLCDIYADILLNQVNNFQGQHSIISGIATDGLYYGGTTYKTIFKHLLCEDVDHCDVDFNLDKVNDFSSNSVIDPYAVWNAGVDRHVSNIASRLPSDKYLFINIGRWYNEEEKTAFASKTNGLLLEHFYAFTPSWRYDQREYQWWMDNAKQPVFAQFDGRVEHKTDYDQMRTIMGQALYGNGYVSVSDQPYNSHWYIPYYDEWGINLGWPKGPMVPVPGFEVGSNGEGVYARFFDNGAVILNINDHNVTVRSAHLNEIPGYDGPYYRFLGGQDPITNNGAIFDSVVLSGSSWYNGWVGGDAILLTKQQTTMVSDIYVDNDHHFTSPGSNPALIDNTWIKDDCDNYSQAWAQSCRNWSSDFQELAIAYTGSSSANPAIYAPTINVAGQYEVFEWHADKTDANEASNVPYTINHAGGSVTVTVNQRQNQGQWNSLGFYTFNKGTQGNVTISAQGANGTVIADAIKFVFQGNYGNIKGEPVPPSEDINQDRRIDSLDLQLAINVLLGVEKDSGIIARADVNRDGKINHLDLQQITNSIFLRR